MGIWKFWAPKITEQKPFARNGNRQTPWNNMLGRGRWGAEEWKLDIITKCRYLDVPGSEEKVTKWIIATTKTPFINRLELTH